MRYFDWVLFFSAILLLSFGLAALYGIAVSYDDPNFANFKKQLIFAGVGIAIVVLVGFFDYTIFAQYAFMLYIIAALLLIAVLFFGETLRGTTGWLNVFGFSFQPVEIAKIALLVFLAKFFTSHPKEKRQMSFMLKTGLITFVYFILVLLQPDFGSGILLLSIWLGLLLVSKIKLRYLLILFSIFLVMFASGWFFVFQDYQKDRIMTFLQPTADPLGSGYHVRQSIIAIGSGMFFGRGLASGSQSQLRFIPASQTDFIFAVIGEEFGFLGSFVVLAIFGVFFYRLIRTAKRANNEFAMYLVLGITSLFFAQFLVNAGMNIGIMPVTGIGLPFVSYGGSFLLVSFLLLGIVQSISLRSEKYKI